MPVARNEVSRLLSVRSEYNEISVGMWARVKNGKYKGDLGQVLCVLGFSLVSLNDCATYLLCRDFTFAGCGCEQFTKKSNSEADTKN